MMGDLEFVCHIPSRALCLMAEQPQVKHAPQGILHTNLEEEFENISI